MSSAKPEAKLSVEQQVKAGLRAVRDFLAGRSGDAKPVAIEDKATRDVVAAELLAKMSGRAIGEAANFQEIPREKNQGAEDKTKHQEYSQNSIGEEQERKRARQVFLDHGYFNEVVQALRSAPSPSDRAAAAHTLGLVGSQRGTAHLIAAMFDDDPEVCSAAEEALNQINDPMAKAAVHAGVHREIKKGNADSAASVIGQPDGREAHDSVEAPESAFMTPTAGQVETPVQETVAESGVPTDLHGATSDSIALDLTATNFVPTVEEEQLLLEEHRIGESAEQLARQLLETAAARKQSEQEVQSRTEREARLRLEAAARRSEEEELRKRAHEEAERRRAEEREALTAEQAARASAETEAQRLAEEETRIRLQAVDLRLAVAELARQRGASETARREAAEAARLSEAKRARDEAKSRHDAELARLHSEEEALRATTDEIALRHADVEAAREKADAEAERLVQAQERMRAAAEARAHAEVERARLEAEINQARETALRVLEETRRQGQEEQERLQEETSRHAEEQKHRVAEMELMKTRAEAESKHLAEKEQQVLNQVNSLRFADSQTRKRIEDAEVRRHAAEDAYRLVAEKVQRVEAEAHARAKVEEQMVRKLEAERRTVALEAQSRAAQEKRISEEIEMFRRLEEQERPRLEAAILQRTQAETRLRQLRERLKADLDARGSAEEELNVAAQYHGIGSEQPAATRWQEHRHDNPIHTIVSAAAEATKAFAQGSATGSEKRATAAGEMAGGDEIDRVTVSNVTPSIVAYLNSVDPFKRAAAVAELARSGAQDAFSLIANCFDDHSPHVRNAAARAFRKLEPNRTVDLFDTALEDAAPERRRNIGSAIAASGLAAEAIDMLGGESREDTYNALCLLLTMAKTGEVQPLVQAIEGHENVQVRMAAIKLLTLTGQEDIANAAAKRRLEGH
jgi:HEAT repeat protein